MMQKMMTRKNELGNMMQSNTTNLGTMAVNRNVVPMAGGGGSSGVGVGVCGIIISTTTN